MYINVKGNVNQLCANDLYHLNGYYMLQYLINTCIKGMYGKVCIEDPLCIIFNETRSFMFEHAIRERVGKDMLESIDSMQTQFIRYLWPD